MLDSQICATLAQEFEAVEICLPSPKFVINALIKHVGKYTYVEGTHSSTEEMEMTFIIFSKMLI